AGRRAGAARGGRAGAGARAGQFGTVSVGSGGRGGSGFPSERPGPPVVGGRRDGGAGTVRVPAPPSVRTRSRKRGVRRGGPPVSSRLVRGLGRRQSAEQRSD